MGLHPFNRDKALRKLRFRQRRGQYIKIGTIILSIIIFIVGIIYYSYSKYTVTNKFDVIQTTVGDFKKCSYTNNQEFTFDYTGAEQIFAPDCDGYYKLETWGAQGGSYNTTYHGGYGGYSIGIISLTKEQTLYINAGGTGQTNCNYNYCTGGYNGGGQGAGEAGTPVISSGGGGATHISFKSGLLSSLINNKESIIIVSGAGGSTSWQTNTYTGVGGSGGGIIGNNGSYTTSPYINGNGGSQSSGGSSGATARGNAGSFGQGGNGLYYSGGGGSGFYGGGASNQSGAGGGSGYINNSLLISSSTLTKHMTCYNCTTSTDSGTYTISNTCTNATATTDCSKTGNGYAKITYLGSTIE